MRAKGTGLHAAGVTMLSTDLQQQLSKGLRPHPCVLTHPTLSYRGSLTKYESTAG